jgi:hypothetical protein
MDGTPYQKRLDLTWLADAPNASNFNLTVPTGKRLVIRQVSGLARMPKGVAVTSVMITTAVGPSNLGANLGELYVPAQFAGTQDGATNVPELYIFNASVVAFAEGPNAVQVLVGRTPAAVAAGQPQGEVDMTVFGYLINL